MSDYHALSLEAIPTPLLAQFGQYFDTDTISLHNPDLDGRNRAHELTCLIRTVCVIFGITLNLHL